MKRIAEIRRAHNWDPSLAVDVVVLDAQERHRRRVVFVGGHGATYLLNLAAPAQLRDGDGLVLEDGEIVRVTGKPEPLVEISAANPREFARLAWQLGNRHAELQLTADKLRIRRDHVLEDMLRSAGATLTFLEAPFEPESGAYSHDEASDGHRAVPRDH